MIGFGKSEHCLRKNYAQDPSHTNCLCSTKWTCGPLQSGVFSVETVGWCNAFLLKGFLGLRNHFWVTYFCAHHVWEMRIRSAPHFVFLSHTHILVAFWGLFFGDNEKLGFIQNIDVEYENLILVVQRWEWPHVLVGVFSISQMCLVFLWG